MTQVICRLTGARDNSLLSGPKPGADFAVLKMPGKRMLIVSTDPVSFIPSLGPARSGWLSVHETASDVATSGVSPRYAAFDLNLPPSMGDRALQQFWWAIHESCRRLGISIVGGHTGRFQGCDYTVVGGATMFTVVAPTAFVTSAMGRIGDDIIATKSAGIEATAVLALSYPRTLKKTIDERTVKRAQSLFTKISVVDDALFAAQAGLHERGVSAMHDVTEGGVLSATMELAESSGLKAQIDSESIPVAEEVREVCNFFRIDPLVSLGQGCLLIASKSDRTREIRRNLRAHGIESEVIGQLAASRTHSITRRNKTQTLRYPRNDPYWKAYANGIKKELD